MSWSAFLTWIASQVSQPWALSLEAELLAWLQSQINPPGKPSLMPLMTFPKLDALVANFRQIKGV